MAVVVVEEELSFVLTTGFRVGERTVPSAGLWGAFRRYSCVGCSSLLTAVAPTAAERTERAPAMEEWEEYRGTTSRGKKKLCHDQDNDRSG